MTGRLFENYRIIDKLGEGGMGKVYRAVDTMVDREVAIKSLKPELAARPEVLERFRSEATMLARLNHPNVAQLYTFFRDGNEFFMVMEFVPGKTLETVIRENGPMPWRQALEIAAQVLDGIEHAHQLGILHRDLKPANIILPSSGRSTGGFQPIAKVTDFGIAQALGGTRMTREGRLVGTLEYIAPERIQGRGADARSDLYSMGIVLFEMLTGRLPFESDSEYSLLLAQVQQQPPRPCQLLPDLPTGVESALLRAMEKDPERRFPTAASFAAALRKHLQAGPPPSPRSAMDQLGQVLSQVASENARALNLPRAFSDLRHALRIAWKDTAFRVAALCGVTVMAALLFLVVALALRRPPEPPPEIAEVTDEQDSPRQTASSTASPETFAPIQPGAPIPIGQILGGDNTPADPSPSDGPASGEGEGETGDPKPAETEKVPGIQVPSGVRVTPEYPVVSGQPVVQEKPVTPPPPRDRVLGALDTTDGPVEGAPGEWPVHRAGLLAALNLSRGTWLPDINRELQRRGVNFLLTPSVERSLQEAGADAAILRTVSNGLRSSKASPAAASAEAKTAAVPAPRRVTRLSDVRKLYVETMEGDLDDLLKREIEKEIGSRLTLTRSAAEADARMVASMETEGGGVLSTTGRIFGLKDKHRVTVRILATGSGRELWKHESGDKSLIGSPFGSAAKNRAVSRIVDRLSKDFYY